ncbi:UDP-glucose 4-epimerase GalE [Ramlibacter sp. 2FC]|uniref:UDP-glucose 4-epimerase GalE n=1 Tax=Ramlibacter sp. 2FC TaxID=2502188 RepID=UPI0010F4C066|nr:UDP-glucose 4-epimerase GalE [Ramlibacter sp. 2FC]
MTSCILITGGAGYIGSHTAVTLMEAGHRVVIVDNLCNSSPRVLERLRQLCGDAFEFVRADLRDGAALDALFAHHTIAGVIHFAGLKAVGESVAQPLRYFDNNLGSTLSLLQAMGRAGVRRLVFSSSATVYGDPDQVPIPETAPLRATNPYGRSKLVCEDMLRDLLAADPRWQVAILRYFNPVGAHPSGLIGEAPNGAPNNLMPYVSQVAVGQRECLQIFGNDYPTPDGTGVRDYIHVMDLARGHQAALRYLAERQAPITVNLGTGRGVSVKELVDTFARVTGRPVAHRYTGRRPGDVAACYADTRLARKALGWQAEHDLARMCEDAWRWQSMNPAGYDS